MGAVELEQSILTSDNRLPTSVTFKAMSQSFHYSLYTLNREEQVAAFATRRDRTEHLTLHGLNVIEGIRSESLLRQYVIGVFQCRTLYTYVSNDKTYWLAGGNLQAPERFHYVKPKNKNREILRMERLAIRAVYALGWDYGVVRLGRASRGRSGVLDVIAQPKLSPFMQGLYEHAFNRYASLLNHMPADPSQLMLGADPEFILVDAHGRLKMASQYFPIRGTVGCDAIWQGTNRSHKPLVELRPRPSHSSREIVIRLMRGMLYAAKKINNPKIRWLAGGLPHPRFPIGGHIHFSGIPLTSALLRALDNYLALPLILVEDERSIKRRPKYGFLGDFRTQFHGGFEYRTPPSWLISPTITKGVLSLARVIALHYHDLNEWPLERIAVQKAYYNGEKQTVRSIVPLLWQDIVSLSTYQEERQTLDAYYHFLLSGKTWNEHDDIRKKWHIPPFHK